MYNICISYISRYNLTVTRVKSLRLHPSMYVGAGCELVESDSAVIGTEAYLLGNTE